MNCLLKFQSLIWKVCPVQSVPSAVPAWSRDLASQQAGPPGFMERASQRSGVRPSNDIVIAGDTAGSKAQNEVESCELVLLVASEMVNPGVLRVCGHCQGQGLVNNQCLVEPVHSPAQAAEVSLPTVR